MKMTAVLGAALFASVAGPAYGDSSTAADDQLDSGSYVDPAPTSDPTVSAEIDEGPVETVADTDAFGRVSITSCRTAKVAYVKKTLLGFVAYKWWMRRSWCWIYPRVTSVSTTTYITDMDGTNAYKGIVASWGRWVQWCCGEPRSAHVAFRQAAFENCILKYGCISTTYPWIRMSVRGDGSYAWAMGD